MGQIPCLLGAACQARRALREKRAGALGNGTSDSQAGEFTTHQCGITFLLKCDALSPEGMPKGLPERGLAVPSRETGKLEEGNAIIRPQAVGGWGWGWG